MKRLVYMMSLVLGFFLFCGCEKQQPEEPDEKPGETIETPDNKDDEDFILNVSDVTSTSCHFSVKPADKEMSYVVMLVEKSEFDSFENEYKYQDDDLGWFELKAIEEGKSLSEWLENFLHIGDFDGIEEGLMPEVSYYLYAYGLDYEGFFTTGVTKLEFTTPAIAIQDLTFDVKVSDIGLTKAKVNVVPSDKDATYFVNVFTVDQYQQWGGDETAFANHAAALVDYYVVMGQTLEAMVANLGSVGNTEIVFNELTDNTEYIAYAVGIDENFYVNTSAEVVRFTTKAPIPSSNTFDIQIQEPTFCSVIGTVTPSNDDPFICVIQAKSQFEDYGSDTEIMYDIANTYQKWNAMDKVLFAGEVVDLEPISSLSPDTEYLLFCFGWDEVPTTALTKVEFKTTAGGGNPRGQELTFVLSDLMHNKVTVTITPKLGLHYFHDCMSMSLLEQYIASEGSEDEAICRFIDERINYGAEFFFSSRAEYLEDMGAVMGKETWTFTGLAEDTEYLIVAATVNVNTGEIVLRKPFKSEVFRTGILVESNASIVFEIDKYYDGTELAELDPVQFSKCKGMVMVPYKITPNADAAHWRTTFAYGEFASWAERDDVLFELDYKCDNDRVQGYAVVHYNQIVSFLGIAEDAAGVTGPFVICEFTAEKGKASPAQEFIDSL